METDYEKLYEDETFALEVLISEKAELERKIARKKQFLVSLGRMLGKTDAKLADIPSSLKLMIIETLRAANEPLSPSQVVNRMKEFGFGFSDYKNPLPPVTTTLKRLVKAKQVSVSTSKGKILYSIKG